MSFQGQQLGSDGFLNTGEVTIIQPINVENIQADVEREVEAEVEVCES